MVPLLFVLLKVTFCTVFVVFFFNFVLSLIAFRCSAVRGLLFALTSLFFRGACVLTREQEIFYIQDKT